MSAAIVAIVLSAAAMHALWHALIKSGDDQFLTYSVINVVAMIVAAVGLIFVPAIDPASYGWLVLSIAAHHLYKVLLIQSYRFGDLSRVFPIARGVAPLIVAAAAAVYLGERLHPAQLTGIVLISAGVGMLAFARGADEPATVRDVALAIATGIVTATYTFVDASGARASGHAIAYVCWIYLADGILFPLVAVVRKRRQLGTFLKTHWRNGLAAGILSISSYGAIVWAMSLGAIGAVAALRETSVVFVTLIGAWCLKESVGLARGMSAGVIVLGVVLIAAFR